MRSYSLFTIVLLCLTILMVDVFAFYWLQSLTSLIASSALVLTVDIAFWVFTVGLISAILILKVRLNDINPKKKQIWVSSLYGLTVSSFIPKLIFVIIITILYTTNAVFSEKESFLIIPIVGLFSGFLPFFIIIFGIFKTVYRFKTYRLKIKLDLLPESFNGLKIVQISDLHLGSFNYRYSILDRAICIINKLEPDLIVFTGDLVNNYAWELRGWEAVFSRLKANIGKFAVLGNHDYGDYSSWKSDEVKQKNFEEIKEFYKKIGFKLLLNKAELIFKDCEEIAVVGVENWGNPPFKQYGNLKQALHDVSHVPFKILLSHDPSHWSEEVLEKTDVALTLSGHTHGMQAGINLGGRKWSPSQYKFKHWAGLYKNKKQYLYVNRGLGWLGFPGRIGMRPEITLIELEQLV
ncbi:metallophosphoesterase [Polaribacter sp. Z014]|uniref:metallophosphoesterase n=1 Tax=Polaribacter sp. Z014 TaxID=2927126 RepID=UPI002021C50D|nr:metallophosphoesterase [Polaribacter sp. Z014]MCL7763000.1 metallophosphoesterase [Polaribacter sp. Z014]